MARRKRIITTPRFVRNIQAAQRRIQSTIQHRVAQATHIDTVQKATKKLRERLTPTKTAYRKERQRIQSYIYRQKRKGNKVDYKVPRTPRIITRRAVTELKGITNEYLRGVTQTQVQAPQTTPSAEVTKQEPITSTQEAQSKTRQEITAQIIALHNDGLTDEEIYNRLVTEGNTLDGQWDEHTIGIFLEGYDRAAENTGEDEELDDEDIEEIEDEELPLWEQTKQAAQRTPPRAADVQLHNMFEMLNNFETLLDGWERDVRWSTDLANAKEQDRDTLRNILMGHINLFGREEVAARLDENAAEIF